MPPGTVSSHIPKYTAYTLVIASYIGVRDLPLQDMLSLGAWGMGIGCSGAFLPSPLPAPFLDNCHGNNIIVNNFIEQ